MSNKEQVSNSEVAQQDKGAPSMEVMEPCQSLLCSMAPGHRRLLLR